MNCTSNTWSLRRDPRDDGALGLAILLERVAHRRGRARAVQSCDVIELRAALETAQHLPRAIQGDAEPQRDQPPVRLAGPMTSADRRAAARPVAPRRGRIPVADHRRFAFFFFFAFGLGASFARIFFTSTRANL